MIYGSLFSGIEAASVAWHPLGWTCAWVAENEPFASAVLAHHYPAAPNLGDVTKVDWDAVRPVDLLVFGSPCQSFSVAGKRLGLDDPRGNLALVALGAVARLRPRWVVFENVPGLLSSDDGRDFGAFLGLLGQCGYGFAYRVLDAQFVRVDSHPGAVPQRRRRVFVVGCAGSWQRAAAVLFEPSSLSGHPPPRREAGQGTARPVTPGSPSGSGYRNDADTADNLIAGTLDSRNGAHPSGMKNEADVFVPEIVPQAMSSKWAKGSSGPAGDEVCNLIAHALRADGFDASEDGTGRGTPPVPTTAFNSANGGGGKPGTGYQAVRTAMAVRRLTPTECERLQGFPDGYTAISRNGKPAADGPRYRALGNSMAVNVMSWIGQRIALLEELLP